MHNLSPNTLFTGRQLIYLPTCSSTNSFAHELLNKNKATEGCVVVTESQTQGRGQRGNTWVAEPGKNITLSVIWMPHFLSVQQQFYLNIAVSLATRDLVTFFLQNNIKLKWPNDVYYGNKKIGGILIENSVSGQYLQHSVIGIGLNINQIDFELSTATSFSLVTGKEYILSIVAEKLLELLEARYLELKAGKTAKLKYEYLQQLYRYQETHAFKVNGEIINGKITGVDELGQLAVEIAGELRYFNLKEIEFVI